MADAPAPNPAPSWWFRSVADDEIRGPYAPEALLDFARRGLVVPGDWISSDRTTWHDARKLGFLGMDTLVVRPDGRVLGPFHPDAAAAFVAEGKVPSGSILRTAKELLESANAPDPSEALKAEFEERSARLRQKATDAIAAKDRELEAVRAELEARAAELAEARAAETSAAEARDAALAAAAGAGEEKGALEAQARELREAQARAEAERDAAESARAEAEAAVARMREEGAGELGALREALEAARADAADARASIAREIAAREDAERAAAEAREDARRSAEAADSAQSAAAEAAASDLAAAHEDAAAARAEAAAAAEARAEAERGLEEARAAAAAAQERIDGAMREAAEARAARTAAERDATAARAEAAEVRAAMEAAKAAAADPAEADRLRDEVATLRAEQAELLEFSNSRDVESQRTIEELRAKLASAEAAAGAPVVPADEAEGPTPAERRLQALQERVTDLSRERGDLAEKLATAEAALAMASHPLEGDIAVVKQFADEALESLRDSLAEEKRVNEEARSASAARQSALHERIGRLERALRRDPGEKSRSELAAERNEKAIAQLRQELDAEREQHKADLGRAAQNEKALDGRIRALQQREASVREQLRRVEQRTADYDSLSSQLRRREEEVVESAKQFAEAREQWQLVEQMLKRRIDELEHGAGSLFEGSSAPEAAGGGAPRVELPAWARNMK